MTLSRLAALSGVGKGTLSELERGQRNPTLDTLFAITSVLRAPLGALLVEVDDSGLKAEYPLSDRVRARAVLLHSSSGDGRAFETYALTIDSTGTTSEPHHEGVRETIVVTAGRVRAGAGESPTELGPGDSLTYRGDREHLFVALGGQAAEAILIMNYPAPNGDEDSAPEL